jgi:hypothetical protein
MDSNPPHAPTLPTRRLEEVRQDAKREQTPPEDCPFPLRPVVRPSPAPLKRTLTVTIPNKDMKPNFGSSSRV